MLDIYINLHSIMVQLLLNIFLQDRESYLNLHSIMVQLLYKEIAKWDRLYRFTFHYGSITILGALV